MWGFNKTSLNTPQQKTISIGTAGTGVTVVNYVSDRDIVTEITFTALTVGTTTAVVSKGIGVLLYTFPAGSHLHSATNMNVTTYHSDAAASSTGKIGVGSVVASGAVSVLNGTSTFMDYVTEQTGTIRNISSPLTTTKLSVATAGALTGISINESGSAKTLYLNIASLWSNDGTVSATGTVSIKWCKLS